jgi:hypothetical protein
LMRKAVSLLKKGHSFTQVGKMLKVAPTSVIYWKNKIDFERTSRVYIDTRLIASKQYGKMTTRQLQIVLWLQRELRKKCENYLFEVADVKPRF